MALKRDIGLIGLTFVAVSGILGSGWLFAPLLTSQLAGPAAVVSWGIGAVAMLLMALCFAEVTTIFPVAGGIARIPQFTHGRLMAMLMGWTAWAGYCTTAPIEVEAALRYSAEYLPWVHNGSKGGLTVAGYGVAAVLLMLFTVVNAFGVRWFARVNTTMTWFKLIAPAVFIVVIISARFEPANFTQYDGFMPYGISGVFGAIASGGVVFAFIGFRHAIDMAGETRNPQRTIPLALILSILICLAVYGGLQIGFLGALSDSDMTGGWKTLSFDSDLGPLGALASAVGVLWLVSLLNVAAVISPLGGGLVSTGSNGRLAMAMANNGVFPRIFAKLNAYGVPVEALLLNYVVAVVMLVAMPFQEIVALNGAAIILSFISGPIAVMALRRLAPTFARPFSLPLAPVLAPAAFMISTLMVFWSGWETTWRLLVLLGLGAALFFLRLLLTGREELDARGVIWFLPYFAGVTVISRLGTFDGGLSLLPAPYDSLAIAVFSLGIFFLAVGNRLSQTQFDTVIAEERLLDLEEYGAPDPEDRFVNRTG